jgi:OmpA-OmpF porin, OOP family
MNCYNLVILAVLGAVVPDAAAQSTSGFYGEIAAGYSFTSNYHQDDFLWDEGSRVSFDGTSNFGGAIGYRFNQRYRTEINISGRKADVNQVDNQAGVGSTRATSYMANFYFDFNPDVQLKPYLGLGLGGVDTDLSYRPEADSISEGFSDVELGLNVIAGASYRVHDRVDLSLGFRYLTLLDLWEELEFHELVFGVRYNF